MATCGRIATNVEPNVEPTNVEPTNVEPGFR